MTRRQMIEQAAAFAAAFKSAAWAATSSSGADFRVGICSYTFREFQRKIAISMMRQLGVSYVSVKDFHLPYTGTP
jgi:inosose dehydratase